MDTLFQDLRHALRQLARSPGFAAVAVGISSEAMGGDLIRRTLRAFGPIGRYGKFDRGLIRASHKHLPLITEVLLRRAQTSK